ncbi:tripartite tricarboxylate transporter substrate binding protein [Leptolyngbya sp. 15MV]|nr:tripartite tricarboxylate transporter substrate binding protein [Leptolyngbya sp. 15MV]
MASAITRRAAALAALGLAVPATARAQAWPSRPIRLIVPFPSGNAADITARTIGEDLSRRLGQSVVVDNRAGASGAIGIQAVLNAPADGYTVLATSLSPISIAPAITPNLPYDPERDLIPVARVGWTGMMMVAAPDFPAQDLAGVIRELRANPGRHSFANVGPGTLSHLTAELFRVSLGLEFDSVTYRGSAQALMDVNAGRVPQTVVFALLGKGIRVDGAWQLGLGAWRRPAGMHRRPHLPPPRGRYPPAPSARIRPGCPAAASRPRRGAG